MFRLLALGILQDFVQISVQNAGALLSSQRGEGRGRGLRVKSHAPRDVKALVAKAELMVFAGLGKTIQKLW